MSIKRLPNFDHDEVCALLRLEAAVRARNYVKENMPGDDLGIRAEAMVGIEINKALKELDEIRGNEFDAKGVYEQMVMENTEPVAVSSNDSELSAGAPDTLDDLP